MPRHFTDISWQKTAINGVMTAVWWDEQSPDAGECLLLLDTRQSKSIGLPGEHKAASQLQVV